MTIFEQLKPNDNLYIVDTEKITFLSLEVVEIFIDSENNQRLKLRNPEITFEIEFDEISDKVYLDKEEARANLVRAIFDLTNKYIKDLTDGFYTDYFELDKGVEKYKNIHPDLFV